MPGYAVGGGRRMDVFTVTVGTTQITLASTTPVYTNTDQISTGLSKDDSGIPTISLDQIQADSAFWNFVDTYAPAGGATAGTAEDITFEDSVQRLGSTASGTRLAVLNRGPLLTEGTDAGKRWSYGALYVLQKSSGSFTWQGNTYGRPAVTLVGAEITLPLVIPSSVLTSYMVTPSTQTIATTTPYGRAIIG